MKTSVFNILILSLPVLLPSCNKEQAKQPFLLKAGVEEAAVKTVLGDKEGSKYPVLWSEGDVIAVNGSLSQPLAAGDAGTSSATFTFDEKPATAGVYHCRCVQCGLSGNNHQRTRGFPCFPKLRGELFLPGSGAAHWSNR